MRNEIFRAMPAEIELARSRSGREVIAYAAIYDEPYRVQDQYGEYDEVIARSAFDAAVRKGPARVIYVYNHGFGLHGKPLPELQAPLGKLVDLRSDQRGLLTRAEVHRTQLGDQILEGIREGSIRHYSFRGPVLRSVPSSRFFRPDPDGRRTTVVRHELGLVDVGPTPLAVNESSEILAVRSALAMRARAGMDDPDEPYGDVEYADPGYQDDGRKRYPIDTERHVRAAWSYIHQRENADRYTPDQLRRIKERIRKAGEKFGITFREDSMRSQIAIASPSLTQDEAVKLATQFGDIFTAATEEPVLMRSIAASLGWRNPGSLDAIEQSLRTIALTATNERYQDIQAERSIIRARLEELAEEGDPDTDDEDEYEQVLAERVDEIDDLVARDEELAEEEADLLYGDDDVPEVDEEDEAYAYA